MITLLAMAGMQPGMIAYDPNLRRYKDGDRWVYTLQGAGLALHTYTVDLVFAKEFANRVVFQARQTAPRGGNASLKEYELFVLFAQMKDTGDARFIDSKEKDLMPRRGLRGDEVAGVVSAQPGALIHFGKWDASPKPASATSFLTSTHLSPPYEYKGKEIVDTGFASIECAVFETNLSSKDRMRFWFNPKIGNYIRAETYLAEPKQTIICYLKETNVLRET